LVVSCFNNITSRLTRAFARLDFVPLQIAFSRYTILVALRCYCENQKKIEIEKEIDCGDYLHTSGDLIHLECMGGSGGFGI
jgi:hypothetical protein